MTRRCLRIAHRGASGECPENTLAAFRRALEIGVDMIEFDVHLSRDGVPVVIHDDDVRRTAGGGPGLVKDMTLAELRRLDAGAWKDPRFAGERIPTLEETLALCRGRCEVNVELKTHPEPYPGIERAAHDLLGRLGMRADATVSSFNWDTLDRYRALDPEMRLGLLADKPRESIRRRAEAARAWSLNLPPMLATGELYAWAREKGLKILVWTVDDPEFIDFLIDYGVDGVISNRPERVGERRLGA